MHAFEKQKPLSVPVSRNTQHATRNTQHGPHLFLFLCCLFLFAGSASSEIETWTMGTEARPWDVWGEMRMMDYLAESGAIQPRAFYPDENVVATFKWYPTRFPSGPEYRKGDPRAWRGYEPNVRWAYGYAADVVDGDPLTADTFFLRVFKEITVPPRSYWTLDFGTPIPASAFVFYPRQEGEDLEGGLCIDNYMKGYKVSSGLGKDPSTYENDPWPSSFGDVPHLENVLGSTEYNIESMVTLTFPPQFMRVFRLQSIVEIPFELAEIEVYADGFAAVATYTSKIIDLGSPFNFGRLEWEGTTLRRTEDGTLVAAPDADVSIGVETRSGADDTPLVYHKTTEIGKEVVITEEEYYHGGLRPAPTSPGEWVAPNQQGSITDDTDHWSFWSLPHSASGEEVTSPGSRQYFQFRITLRTNAVDELARVDSLSFQVSPPLADEVVGEVSVSGEPTPLDDVAHVAGGERTTFVYDLRATVSPGQHGFDGLEIAVPSEAIFGELLMGDPLVALPREEYEVASSTDRLVVRFPSHRIEDGTLVRVVFDTSVLVFGTRFLGKVFDTEGNYLPQPIQSGNANEEVSTDKLWVWVTEESLQGGLLTRVSVDPEGITPNEDGINDEARISYTLLQLTGEALVEVSIRELSGAPIRKVYGGRESNGRYDRPWDGRDDGGNLVPPGMYLYTVSVTTDAETTRKVGRIAVVY